MAEPQVSLSGACLPPSQGKGTYLPKSLLRYDPHLSEAHVKVALAQKTPNAKSRSSLAALIKPKAGAAHFVASFLQSSRC
jgi:hypothetical protein